MEVVIKVGCKKVLNRVGSFALVKKWYFKESKEGQVKTLGGGEGLVWIQSFRRGEGGWEVWKV